MSNTVEPNSRAKYGADQNSGGNHFLAGLRKWLTWLGLTLAVPVVLVAVWQIAATANESLFWPAPSKIVQAFPATWFEGRLTEDVFPSLYRLVIGFGIALAFGVIMGLIIGSFRRVRLATEPIFEFFRSIPPPVLVPVVMLIAGIGQNMQITVIAFGCFWPILINAVEGVRGIDLTQTDTAHSYRIRGWRRLCVVVLPAASPKIFAGARQALSLGIIMMVISEMFAAANGIGYNIIEFQRLFRLTEMWTGIVLLGIIGVIVNAIFKFIERRVLRWYLGMQDQER